MKRALIILASIAPAVVVGVIGLAALRDSGSPDFRATSCPTYVSSALVETFGSGYRIDRWHVYAFESERGAPQVGVRPPPVSPVAGTFNSCELKINWAPETPGKASDWRIGHTIAEPGSLRGRVMTFRVLLKGSTDFEFDTGTIYIHDGVKVAGIPIRKATRDWQRLAVSAQIDPSGTNVEVWVRLLLDSGTIRPRSGTLYFVPELSVGSLSTVSKLP